mmetsp:Transcript_32203/g.87281  ORF Transcript_32203/g.87281 Transcript_32203/m.87281 type:complete len:119 (-) Transcript_32203:113-469(-)
MLRLLALIAVAAAPCSANEASQLDAALGLDDACAAGNATSCELSLRQLRGDLQPGSSGAARGTVSCCCASCGQSGCYPSILQCNACDDNSCPNQVNWGLTCGTGPVSSVPGVGCKWNE